MAVSGQWLQQECPTFEFERNAMPEWTAERIAQLNQDDIKALRENATRYKRGAIIELCDAELASRRPQRAKKVGNTRRSDRDVVHGFHFVCSNEQGVTRNIDGTVWTGTWVVDKIHAERATKIGAYVALHASRSDPSYLQGIVRDWRPRKRAPQYADDRPARIPFGVEFLIELINEPKQWQGDATGEKGYWYGHRS